MKWWTDCCDQLFHGFKTPWLWVTQQCRSLIPPPTSRRGWHIAASFLDGRRGGNKCTPRGGKSATECAIGCSSSKTQGDLQHIKKGDRQMHVSQTSHKTNHHAPLWQLVYQKSLKTKLADLEGCSRQQEPSAYLSCLNALFLTACSYLWHGGPLFIPKLDHAHRSLAPKSVTGEKPQPVIIRLHCFQVKDLLINEACRQGDLFYKEHEIWLFEDYSPDMLKQRAKYKNSMAELYKHGY